MMPEYDRCLGYVLYSLKCVHEDSSGNKASQFAALNSLILFQASLDSGSNSSMELYFEFGIIITYSLAKVI